MNIIFEYKVGDEISDGNHILISGSFAGLPAGFHKKKLRQQTSRSNLGNVIS